MDKTIYFDQLFPTTVLYQDSSLVTNEIVELSKEIINEHANSPFYSSCLSTVHTFSDVFNIDGFQPLRDLASEVVAAYFNHHKIDSYNRRFTCSWLNYYDKGGYQDLHNHSSSLLSGVIWIQSNEDKDFIFQAPWHFMQPIEPVYNENNKLNSHNIEYASKIGRCMVFMSHALHRTTPATGPRISLSFNVA